MSRDASRGRVAGALLLAAVGTWSLFAQTPAADRRLPGPGSGMQRRVALVIGNDAYRVQPLANAVNDAVAVSAALKRIGFEVDGPASNLDGESLERRVQSFVSRVNPGDVAVFFYAGHGIQVGGANYLVPTDFDAEDEIQAKRRAYPVDDLRERLEESGAALKLIVLDACRNNPFRYARARGGTGGLAPMQPGRGTLLAMATAPGQTASDNPGSKNGLFTENLLKVIEQPGLKVRDVFERVQVLVDQASGRKQLPWVEGIVLGDYYLVPPGAAAASSTAGPASPPVAPVPALAPPPAVGGVDVAALEARAKVEAQWGEYQTKLRSEFQRISTLSGSPSLKATAWESWLSTYATDNPLTPEDDELRNVARTRLASARSEAAIAAAAAQVARPPSPAVTSPSLPIGRAARLAYRDLGDVPYIQGMRRSCSDQHLIWVSRKARKDATLHLESGRLANLELSPSDVGCGQSGGQWSDDEVGYASWTWTVADGTCGRAQSPQRQRRVTVDDRGAGKFRLSIDGTLPIAPPGIESFYRPCWLWLDEETLIISNFGGLFMGPGHVWMVKVQ